MCNLRTYLEQVVKSRDVRLRLENGEVFVDAIPDEIWTSATRRRMSAGKKSMTSFGSTPRTRRWFSARVSRRNTFSAVSHDISCWF